MSAVQNSYYRLEYAVQSGAGHNKAVKYSIANLFFFNEKLSAVQLMTVNAEQNITVKFSTKWLWQRKIFFCCAVQLRTGIAEQNNAVECTGWKPRRLSINQERQCSEL